MFALEIRRENTFATIAKIRLLENKLQVTGAKLAKTLTSVHHATGTLGIRMACNCLEL
jgi:hypothetical protein